MPILVPSLDDRRYQQLLEEALARIPVHTPEWTNFNASDPGVTLIQVFAFLSETLLYRANQIPERNRRKFLELLGLPLQAAAAGRGLVTISNERGPLATLTLDRDLEVRAGAVPFRTRRGLDVLPIEAHVCFKRRLTEQPEDRREYYRQLYASFLGDDASADPQADVELYELVPLSSRGVDSVDVGQEAVDRALWIALLARPNEPLDDARRAIAGKTLSLGLVPQLDVEDARRRLAPRGTELLASQPVRIEMPAVPPDGRLPAGARPAYRIAGTLAMPSEPATFEIALPAAGQLSLWSDLDPLELGADDFPPTLADAALEVRVITWLRLVWPEGAPARLVWAGINAAPISQRTRIGNELLPDGNGEPDQTVTLAHPQVIPDSVRLVVTTPGGSPEAWQLIDDLFAAGPEVAAPDLREPPGRLVSPPAAAKVFVLDTEAGRVRFGDGARGARPPAGATLRVSYDYGAGGSGNVGAGAVNQAPALAAGLRVSNPVRTWGGTDAETVAEGEKQITRYLQHRDRLVTADDFSTITRRTPGREIGRVEVLAACDPTLASVEPGNAPGAVTLMIIPKSSALRPDAPSPDAALLAAVCAWLEPRRLVTMELFLRGPDYVPLWISVGIDIVAAGDEADAPSSTAVVREAVKRRLREFLAAVRADGDGWPLRRAVVRLELMAEVSRVPGVASVAELLLATADGAAVESVPLAGLQLPRIDGLEVAHGPAVPLEQMRGGVTQPAPARRVVPVPAIPKEC